MLKTHAIRTIANVRELYKSYNAAIRDDRNVYYFDNVFPANSSEDLLFGETTILPGNVNQECFFTKGHVHNTPAAEVYYCISGEGIILKQFPDGTTSIELIDAGSSVYIEPNVVHRAINTGKSELKLYCVCRADAGHNYDVKINTRVFDRRSHNEENVCIESKYN